jgi:hypothetical protein
LVKSEKLDKSERKPKQSTEWIWWTAVAILIVGTIAFLVVIDAIYAPKAYDPAVLPQAVGK